MSENVLKIERLGFPWQTTDPFLFCVHHNDAYPEGDEAMAPRASLAGRNIGSDFSGKDGWSMYHGDRVPGFPQHPHRGFETVTIARRGFIDHSDSLGASARFGQGDVQWMTAGAGVVHSEMFPLLERDAPNPVELFQIWLNLPSNKKMAPPHFAMLWDEGIPSVEVVDGAGRRTQVRVVAGTHGGSTAPPPPPDSWASTDGADVAIWTAKLEAGARWTLDPAQPGTLRSVYFFVGSRAEIAGRMVERGHRVVVRGEVTTDVVMGAEAGEVLVLQGRPIGEPVVQYGPFVLNTQAGIQQAFMDYQRTRFGGWPWPHDAPVHARDAGRFARRPGSEPERPTPVG